MQTLIIRKRRYVTLDGMRGVAAFFVVLRHFGDLRGAPQGQFSYLAVDIFFLLSGFVLSLSYTPAFAKGMSTVEFMRRRFIRLLPLYAVGTALGLVLWTGTFFGGTIKYTTYFSALIMSLLMLPAPTWHWAVKPLFPIMLPAWSLFFELYVANLLFAIARGRLTSIQLMVVIGSSGVCLLAAATIHGSMDLGATWPTLLAGVPRVCFSFFTGVFLQQLHARRPPRLKVPSWLMLLVLAGLLMPSIAGVLGRTYECLCVFVAFPALIFWGAEAIEARPWLGRVLGDTSFAVYAIHYPLIRMLGILLTRTNTEPSIAVEAVVLPLILLAAYGLDRYFDRPVGAALARRTFR